MSTFKRTSNKQARTRRLAAWLMSTAAAVVLATALPAVAVDFNSVGGVQTQTFAGPSTGGSFNVDTFYGDNRYLLVGYQHERAASPANQITALTYGGTPLTLAHREINPSNQEVSEIWYLANPAIGSAPLTATLDGSTESGRGFRLTALSLTGAPQTAPDAVAGSSVTGTSASTAITTTVDDATLFGFTHHQGSGAHTPGTGVTELFDIDAVSIRAALGTKDQPTAGATTFDWDSWSGGTLNAQTVTALGTVAAPTVTETTVGVDIGQSDQTASGLVQAGFIGWDLTDTSPQSLTLTDPFGTGDDVDVSLTTDTAPFGTSGGTRDRGIVGPTTSPQSDLLRDFIFEQDGSIVTLAFDGLPEGDYRIDVYSHDDDFSQGNADVSLTDANFTDLLVGNANTTTNADIPFEAFSTLFAANGTDLVSLEFDINGNQMFNGFELTRLETVAIPEPASLALWILIGLGVAGMRVYRRRRNG